MRIQYRSVLKMGGSSLVLLLFIVLTLGGGVTLPASAAPLQQAPLPMVTLDVPSNVQIGADFTFTVTFDNASATATGYGPFVDLYFPVNGIDGVVSDPQDGIDFINVEYLGSDLTGNNLQVITFGPTRQTNHPYLRDTSGAPIVVQGAPGDKLVVVQLPFGSFVPGQPPIPITVNAHLSNMADINMPLSIRARGGFRYGADPLDDWCCDPPVLSDSGFDARAWSSASSVNPTLITIDKQYSFAESETATGPNYPRQYTITVDAPDGQTIENLVVTDYLPDNAAFLSVDSISPAGSVTVSPPVGVSASDNQLEVTIPSVTGGSGASDVTITYSFFIPLNDSNGASVLSAETGAPTTSPNRVQAVGDWTPLDDRDPGAPGNAVANENCPACAPAHTLTDKSIAIQKAISGGPYTPGATIEYTLNFQVSDYFAFENVIVTDTIADGQHFDPSFRPLLEVNGNTFVLSSTGIADANFTVEQDYTGAIENLPVYTVTSPPHSGNSILSFLVSDQIVVSGQSTGRLIGGCVPVGGTSGAAPDCSVYNNDATTGRIVYRTVIQDHFTDAYSPNDPTVDHGDIINNQVVISGDLLSVDNASSPTGNSQSDGSQASAVLEFGRLSKSIYAVNGVVCASQPCTDIHVSVGQTLTYRIQYTLPTSDFERLTFTDLLPKPVFDVGDADADGAPGPAWALDDVISADAPAAGHVKFGPAETFRNLAGDNGQACVGGNNQPMPPTTADGTPCISANTVDNSLRIDYGNYGNPANTASAIDLLLTVQVTSQPFTDGLFLTNQVSAHEGTTNAADQSQTTIVPFTVHSPFLVTTKSAVSSDNLNAVISAPLPVTFNAPGAGDPPWVAPLNSTMLAATPIDSDISNVNAGDLVRFAIVIENQGSGLNGAFNITLKDTLPPGYVIPSGGINLQVLRGDGTAVTYTGLGGGAPDFFNNGIRLDDNGTTGACEAHSLDSGRNIVLITYDAQVAPDAIPDQEIENTASLLSYSSQPGGENFLEDSPLTDHALTRIPTVVTAKDLVSSEIENTANARDQVVIGEKVTYTVTVTVPHGVAPSASLVDTLDNGLAFVEVRSVDYSSGVSASTPIGTGTAPANVTIGNANGGTGNRVTFNFGTLTNANSDNDTPDTVTIVYDAVVLNITGNRSGTQLNNSVVFHWTSKNAADQDVPRSTPPVSSPNVTVIEPLVTISKSANPITGLDALDELHYAITLTGTVTDAFDVTLNDPLPALFTNPSIVGVTPSGTTAQVSDFQISGCPSACVLETTPSADIDLPVGATVTIEISGTLGLGLPPSGSISNTATTRWTSLDGTPGTRSDHNQAAVERTGEDGSGANLLNNYANQSTVVVVTSNPIVLTKSIVATSEDSTSDPNVAIGEIVRYRLSTRVPEGTMTNLQFMDTLPTGLTYIADDTAKVAFICNGGPTCLTSSTLSGAGLIVAGDSVTAPPTFVPPSDAAVVTTVTGGTRVAFSLGDVVNHDNDPDAEYVVVEFNALVNNIAANVNGTTLTNRFAPYVNGSQSGSSVATADVVVRTPQMTMTKGVSPNANLDAGDTVTYTVTFANAGTASATAFDARLTDTLPATLALNLSSVSAVPVAACGPVNVTNTSAANTVDLLLDRLSPGCSVTVTFDATLQTSITPNQTIGNTADLVYTSLPGPNGTTPNPTESSNTGLPGSNTGERDGSGGINNFHVVSSVNLTTRNIVRSKTLVATELDNPGNAALSQATIGELLTYQIVITVPEGTTPNLTVQDTMNTGLALAGDCAVALPYTITVSNPAQVITNLADGWPSACPSATAGSNPLVSSVGGDPAQGDGRRVTWNLGTITNTNTDNGVAETITIQFQAVVLNLNNGVYNNQNNPATNRGNQIVVSYGSTSMAAVASATVAIVEPTVNTAKTVSAGPYNAGDPVAYTITLTNPPTNANPTLGSTTAYNVTLNDPLPAELISPAITNVSGGGFTAADFTISGCPTTCTLQTSTAGGIDIPAGTVVVIEVTGSLDYSVTPGQEATNTATTRWTSLPGALGPRSTYNPAAVERNGSGGLLNTVGVLNDYGTTDSVSLTVRNVAPVKSIVQTSEASTAGDNVTIGEIVRYHLAVQIPQGTSPNFQIHDVLPAGLTFLNDNSARVALVCNGGATPCMTASNIGNPAGLVISGDSGAPTPTAALPDNAVSRSTSGNDDGYTPGDPVYFSLGNVVNNDNDPDAEYVVIEFNALVNNVAGNVDGITRTNYFNVLVNGAQNGPSSNDTTVAIVEPALSITKIAAPLTPSLGGTVNYSLSLEHAGASTTSAFDVVITDTLVQGSEIIALNLASINVSDAPTSCASGISTAGSAGQTVEVRIGQLPLGCAVTVTYTAQVGSAGQVFLDNTINNNVTTVWTSLPGTGSTGNSTGSTTPGASGDDDGERDGSGGTNNYTDGDSAEVTVTGPDLRIVKTVDNLTPASGDPLIYTLAYDNNNGNVAANDVTITETVPQYTRFDPSAGALGWICAGTGAAGDTCTLLIPGELPVGGSGSVQFAVLIDETLPAGVAAIHNTASVTDDGSHGPDGNPEDNQDTVDTSTVTAAPDLSITKSDGVEIVAPGATLTYTLTVNNNGNQGATGVVITDTLPVGITFVSASDDGVYDDAARTVTWAGISIASGQQITRTLVVTVNNPLPAGTTQLENLATVEDDGANGDDATSENNSTQDIDTISGADKSLTATDQDFTSLPSVAIGEILTYQVSLRVKPGSLEDLQLIDVLDRGLAFIDCEVSGGADITTEPVALEQICAFKRTIQTEPVDSTNPADMGRKMTLDFGKLTNVGTEEEALVVQYRVAALNNLENKRGVQLRNNAEWKWTGGTMPLITTPVTIIEPELSLSKEADVKSAIAGQIITYTLTVKHTSESNSDAFDVVLTDVVPAELIYVPDSFTLLSGPAPTSLSDVGAPTLTARWATFPLNQTAVLQFQARVFTARDGITIRNTALVTWTSIPGDRTQPTTPYNPQSTERTFQPSSTTDVYQAQSTAGLSIPEINELPRTGFAPGVVTALPNQPAELAYQSAGDLWLEVPALSINLPVTGVPLTANGWDLTWLGAQAGWLEGTAYPGLDGNTAITAHAFLPSGLAGPFAQLNTLKWGDVILLHANGQVYRYEVRERSIVAANDLTPLKHETRPWLTLFTCRGFDAKSQAYQNRAVIRAVLISID